jgi:hypothetical protein
MIVPIPEGSLKRLLQQSIPPAGTATPDQLRTMIQTLIQRVVEAKFTRT